MPAGGVTPGAGAGAARWPACKPGACPAPPAAAPPAAARRRQEGASNGGSALCRRCQQRGGGAAAAAQLHRRAGSTVCGSSGIGAAERYAPEEDQSIKVKCMLAAGSGKLDLAECELAAVPPRALDIPGSRAGLFGRGARLTPGPSAACLARRGRTVAGCAPACSFERLFWPEVAPHLTLCFAPLFLP